MTFRFLRGLGLLAATALVLSGGPVLAAHGAARTFDDITFVYGADSPFGGTRFDGQYDAANGRIYFLGFRTFADATDGSVWYYTVASGTYTDTGVDMPVPVSNYGIASLSDSTGLGFYIFGGRDANAQIITTVQVYRPATNTASIVSTDPWPGTTPLGCVSLPAMGVSVVANRGIVMGGVSFAANGCQDDNSAQTWLFDANAAAGSRWTQGPDLNLARGYVTPAVLGKRVYAIGGDINVAGSLFPQTTVESWLLPAGGWDDAGAADLPEACDESQAFGFTKGPLARTIVLAGCGQWPNAVNDVLQYGSVQNAWSIVGVLNESRRNQAGAYIPAGNDSQMFILGGYDCPANTCGADPTQTLEIGQPVRPSGVPRDPDRAGVAAGRPARSVATS